MTYVRKKVIRYTKNPFAEWIIKNKINLSAWTTAQGIPYQIAYRLKRNRDITGAWLVTICKRSGVDINEFQWEVIKG